MMQKIQRFGGAMFTPVLLFAFAGITVGLSSLFMNEQIFGTLAAADGTWYKVWNVIQEGGWTIFRNMPLILHVRDAFAETVEVLREFPSERLRGVFHSFTGTPDEAAVISSLGDFKLGINGVVTFKKSDWREALPFIGLENLLLETDCPYLTPVPYRGRRNESAYVAYVCQKLAEIFGVSVDEVDRLTTENAKRLFGL